MALIALVSVAQGQIPDAPSASKPPQQQAPDAPSATRPQLPQAGPPLVKTNPNKSEEPPPPPNPAPSVAGRAIPRRGADPVPGSARDQMFTLTKNVNFVVVPVTVKDSSGVLVDGLLKDDFVLYEDGQRQDIKIFTSDPFPLSVAVIIDVGMAENTLRKVDQTLSALTAAFSPFDEVAVYTYDRSVERVSDFTAVDERLTQALQQVQKLEGRRGAPMVGGPMSGGPSINNRPFDPGQPRVAGKVGEREAHVLNDAIATAALDLGERDRGRWRKVIFVIGDGEECESSNSYNDVLKILLSNEVTVYGVGVESSGIPVFRELMKVDLPGGCHGNLLPKYASATGGEVFPEVSRAAIEQAYSHLMHDARNQYTIGYTTRPAVTSVHREIDVRVIGRPFCKRDRSPNCVSVYAKEGYYTLPSRPSGGQ
jgi:VWFA-related protein